MFIDKRPSRGRTKEGKPNPIDVYVGSKIKIRRCQIGLSQVALSELIGVTFQQIQKYERGTNRIAASRIWDIAQALQVEVSYFFAEMDKQVKKQSPRHLLNCKIEYMRLDILKMHKIACINKHLQMPHNDDKIDILMKLLNISFSQ